MKNIIHQEEVHQLNILDDRFYTLDHISYYPSVTTILEALPDNFGLKVWKKDLGHAADEVLKRAANEGANVHDAIQAYLQGQEVRWVDNNGKGYNLSEWTSICRFMEFWDIVKAKVIALEVKVLSVNLRLGGAIDLVCIINGEIWIIDYKTSNYFHDSFWLQVSAYATIWNERYPDYKIQRCGILHLKAETRGPDKTGKSIQGKGWKLYPMDQPYSEEWEFFCTLRKVWDRTNPDYKPKNLKMPDRFKLNAVQQPVVINDEPSMMAGQEKPAKATVVTSSSGVVITLPTAVEAGEAYNAQATAPLPERAKAEEAKAIEALSDSDNPFKNAEKRFLAEQEQRMHGDNRTPAQQQADRARAQEEALAAKSGPAIISPADFEDPFSDVPAPTPAPEPVNKPRKITL